MYKSVAVGQGALPRFPGVRLHVLGPTAGLWPPGGRCPHRGAAQLTILLLLFALPLGQVLRLARVVLLRLLLGLALALALAAAIALLLLVQGAGPAGVLEGRDVEPAGGLQARQERPAHRQQQPRGAAAPGPHGSRPLGRPRLSRSRWLC